MVPRIMSVDRNQAIRTACSARSPCKLGHTAADAAAPPFSRSEFIEVVLEFLDTLVNSKSLPSS